MFSDGIRYEVELLCRYPEWWRFNLYMIVVGYDATGNRVFFDNYTDRVYELEFNTQRTGAPAGYDPARPVKIVSNPCDHVEVYVYVVTNTFPDSTAIKDSPPFTAVLRVTPAGGRPQERSYEVNQWGGLTIVAERFSVE